MRVSAWEVIPQLRFILFHNTFHCNVPVVFLCHFFAEVATSLTMAGADHLAQAFAFSFDYALGLGFTSSVDGGRSRALHRSSIISYVTLFRVLIKSS